MNLIIMPVVAGPAMTRACITSLQAQDIGNVVILAYDNGSQDGCGPLLRSYSRHGFYLVSNAKRQSLNKVWNNALSLAFDSMKLNFACVVNNDTVLLPETFRLLADDGGLFVTGVGTDPAQPLVIGDLSMKRPHPDFSCFLMRRECWERVGPLDEQINAFYGDNDYHIRMHRAGVEAVSIQVPFAHIASGTMKNASNELRDQIQAEAGRDREYFQQKYGFLPATREYEEEFL